MRIEGGEGQGREAAVSKDLRLLTEAIAFSPIQMAALTNRAYALSTGVISITGVTESGLLYIRNDDPSRTLLLPELTLNVGKCTGGPGDQLFQLYYLTSASGGTLISGASLASLVSLNVGSPTPPKVTVYKGVYAATVIGGVVRRSPIIQDAVTLQIPLDLVMPAGSQIAVTVTANASTSAMKVAVAARFSMLDAGV